MKKANRTPVYATIYNNVKWCIHLKRENFESYRSNNAAHDGCGNLEDLLKVMKRENYECPIFDITYLPMKFFIVKPNSVDYTQAFDDCNFFEMLLMNEAKQLQKQGI